MILKLVPDASGIKTVLDAVEEKLTAFGLKRREITRAMLACEELISSMTAFAPQGARMQLSLRKLLGDITIEISMPGEAYDFAESLQMGLSLDTDDIGQDAQNQIRSIILRSFAEDLKYRHRSGTNSVRLTVLRSKQSQLYYTLGAIVLAVVTGLLLKAAAPSAFLSVLNESLLTSIKTMFMNGLKMVVAPVVFFSIVSCISQFGSLSEMGKVGGKVVLLYLITTLLATGIGIGTSSLLQPGAAAAGNEAAAMTAAVSLQPLNVSLKDTIVNIVPNNFVKPFVEANMLQLIFLAVFCGIAVGMIGKYSKMLSDFFEACNELFLKITVLLVKFIPIATFCSILSMVLETGAQTLMSILSMCLALLLGLAAIMLIYCLMILVLARLNPIPFIQKYAPTMLQVFSMASSNASLPLNMEACQKKLGVSSKVYSLSLPLGATMNMDGTCIYLGVFALALAQMYGVPVTGAAMMSVVMSIIVLSIGAPGVPGSGLICLSVLLSQLGVPVEAVGLVMGIDPLIGMLRTMSNCLGDVAVSTIVAKNENLLDMSIYQNQAQ